MNRARVKFETGADLFSFREQALAKQAGKRCYLAVCGDTGCSARGSKPLREALVECLARKGLTDQVDIKYTGCLGLCECGPVVIVFPRGIFYSKVEPGDADEIVTKTVLEGAIVERLLYSDPAGGARHVYLEDIPFYRGQQRTLLGDIHCLEPTALDDYVARRGYEAALKALTEMTPGRVIEEIKKARLRGRGGAGFPVAAKWEQCHRAGGRKFIICNADEGDPGAFMDRSLLEGIPHAVLEGLLIGGYATGANEGIFYVRAEYPSAVAKVRETVKVAEEAGLLGENILGSGFSFQVYVNTGAGAFVCGETSALIASVDGRIGEPRQKPPHLAESGYLGRPTVINNVETLANVPVIIRDGAASFQRTGTKRSCGTKIFSLVGAVNNTGLVEVPLGMSLRRIIFDLGGGIRGDGQFKAVQTGGPSGGCLPASLLDLPTDYESLLEAGSMMGSGGMIVLDENSCMVDLARYFLRFLADESCGCCFSCREGIARMLEIIDTICQGRGSMEQLNLLKDLAWMVKETTLCGLGQTAPNPVMSTLAHFEDEYLAHILERRCPAGVCQALISYTIEDNICNGCMACVKKCPSGAIGETGEGRPSIGQDSCEKCGVCLTVCRSGAIMKNGRPHHSRQ